LSWPAVEASPALRRNRPSSRRTETLALPRPYTARSLAPPGRHAARAVGLSWSHERGIRPQPLHIPHGASQDHWRGSVSSRLHSNRPRPPHPGQGTVGFPRFFSCLGTIRCRGLPAMPTPSWGSVHRFPFGVLVGLQGGGVPSTYVAVPCERAGYPSAGRAPIRMGTRQIGLFSSLLIPRQRLDGVELCGLSGR
jgi:hypothetical protein